MQELLEKKNRSEKVKKKKKRENQKIPKPDGETQN